MSNARMCGLRVCVDEGIRSSVFATRHARHRERGRALKGMRQPLLTVELMYDLVSNSVVLCREEGCKAVHGQAGPASVEGRLDLPSRASEAEEEESETPSSKRAQRAAKTFHIKKCRFERMCSDRK